MANACSRFFFLKIISHTFLQTDGFTHVEHLFVDIEITVNPWQARESSNLCQQFSAMAIGNFF